MSKFPLGWTARGSQEGQSMGTATYPASYMVCLQVQEDPKAPFHSVAGSEIPWVELLSFQLAAVLPVQIQPTEQSHERDYAKS